MKVTFKDIVGIIKLLPWALLILTKWYWKMLLFVLGTFWVQIKSSPTWWRNGAKNPFTHPISWVWNTWMQRQFMVKAHHIAAGHKDWSLEDQQNCLNNRMKYALTTYNRCRGEGMTRREAKKEADWELV